MQRINKLAQERKNELLELLKKTKEQEFKNNIIHQIALLSSRHALRRTKNEKNIYCKYCKTAFNSKTKTRIRGFKKDKTKKLQKMFICDNCGKEQRITL